MLLYHEQQVGALCGVHCLNTLLQGPLFTEIDLAQMAQDVVDPCCLQIAQELDRMETELLGGAASGEAGNVAADGMFSSQVLSMALGNFNLSISPITSPEMEGVSQEPQREAAFICNLQEHWFTIRRVGEGWYNFNSIYPGPEALGTFYLAAYLASLRDQGYTIFVVRGVLPQPALPAEDCRQGRWMSPEEAKRLHEAAGQARQVGRANHSVEQALARAAAGGGTMQLRSRRADNSAAAAQWGQDAGEGAEEEGDEEGDLRAAIAASMQDAMDAQTAAGFVPVADDDNDADLMAALAASQEEEMAAVAASLGPDMAAALRVAQEADRAQQAGAGTSASAADRAGAGAGPSGTSGPAGGSIAASAPSPSPGRPVPPVLEPPQAEPEPGEGVIELAFRLPGGARVMRRFPTEAPTSQLFSFLAHGHELTAGAFTVHTQFPRKEVACSTADSLKSAGLEHRAVLTVDRKL